MDEHPARADRRRLLLACAGAAAALSAPRVRAQNFPNRTLRLLVGYAAGGGVDAMARLLATRLTSLGQQVIVENRPGASSAIAADVVAKAPPDGYTLLVGESALLIAPHLGVKLPFDPLRGFAPVCGLFVAPLMIVANNALPASGPGSLVALLKRSPGRYSYATSGVGTVHHLGFELMKARTGTFVVHIPYRGASQILPDVISGQVPLGVVSASAGMAQARSGRVRPLAMMSTARVPGADQVRPLADALPGFDVAPRLFLAAPSGTPQQVVDRLSEAASLALGGVELLQAAAQQGAVPAFTPASAIAADLARESGEWARIVQSQNITAN